MTNPEQTDQPDRVEHRMERTFEVAAYSRTGVGRDRNRRRHRGLDGADPTRPADRW